VIGGGGMAIEVLLPWMKNYVRVERFGDHWCAKLAASVLCNFIKFISFKLSLRDTIVMTSLLQDFLMYLFKLKYSFKTTQVCSLRTN
jgi:hypothetical protein